MKQRRSLDKEFETDYDEKKGILLVAKKKIVKDEFNYLILFNSQEIRTTYKGMPADINISFVNEPIYHSQDIDETAKIGREEGGFVSVCHGNSFTCSAGMEKTIEMVKTGKVDTAECFNSTESPECNTELRTRLEAEGIYGVAVPDSHHYTNDASFFKVNGSLYENFSVENFRNAIKNREFENHYSYMANNLKFINHKLPILILLPLTTLKHPIANTKALINAVLKRK